MLMDTLAFMRLRLNVDSKCLVQNANVFLNALASMNVAMIPNNKYVLYFRYSVFVAPCIKIRILIQ